ncbi:hypothetical protein BGZ95_001297 [Linnemannia exigua]|uniref:cysteine synthase n=1 Tax=Linnemannia exigua TaxID=604196 RepID=A0AAD4D732_9FUNG|nr:hypothetical protein BGZ95_001297 [Linnemannia exigua]
MRMLESLSDKNKHIAIGAALGIFFTLSTTAVILATRGSLNANERRNSQPAARSTTRRRSSIGENISKQIALPKTEKNNQICDGVAGLIGDTPMMRIKSLSDATGCEILAKAEFLNPGGSTKDRVALSMINMAEKERILTPGNGSTIFEGTVGSTGISLAMMAKARGYNAWIVMPDDVALEKQTQGNVDAIVMGAGTGGTLAGVTKYLKALLPDLKTYLVDPQGSGLFNKVKYNIMYSPTEKEGKRKRHQVDTVVEGVGINRLTRNFAMSEGYIDDAIRVTDQEAVDMARYLVNQEGLFIGSSSAVNCVGAVRIARELGPGHTIVTLLCDSGQRHLTKFWNDAYLAEQGLIVKDVVDSLDFIV